jgi:hypothetical protein
MATVAELQARLSSLERLIDANQVKVAALTREQESIQQQRRKLLAGGDTAGAAVLRAQENAIDDQIASLQSQYQDEAAALRREIAGSEAQQANASAPQPAPPATAAQTAQDDAPAGPTAPPEQKVGPDGRVTDVPPNTAPSNAEVTPTQQNPQGTTSGTNAPVKPVEQTQAINTDSNSGQALKSPAVGAGAEGTAGEAEAAGAVVKPGTASQSDDNTPAGSPQTAVNAEEQTGPNVKYRPNVLDEYSSYSYSASVYLMTEVQYARLLQSTNKKIDGYQLLFQSGGAANNVGGIRPPNTTDAGFGAGNSEFGGDAEYSGPDGGRNPFFDNDFYIDSITIENLPPGKSTGSAHNVAGIKFTLIEPNGITLLDRLYDAVANQAPKGADGKVNYTAATYLMVIRFYGYDANGNLEQVRSKPDQEGTSDPAAIVEKFIPFKIKSLNWSVGTKLVSYEWEGVPVGQMIAGYTNRGTIPADVQLVNTTVGGLLGGPAKYSSTTTSATNPGAATTFGTPDDARQGRGFNRADTGPATTTGDFARADRGAPAPTPAPSNAAAAPTNKTTITGGLMGAMNEFQAKLVKDGVFTVADEYVIEFIGPEANKIRDAKLQLPNTKVDKRMTAAAKSTTQDAQLLDQAKTSVDMISRSFSITAGQQLLQAIDLTIRNSSYISEQALVIVNPDGSTQPNPNSRDKPLKWYTIGMSAVAIGDKIDPKRNDFAYKITYTVAAREVKNMISKYFPISKFSGVHKRYPYWFTGENIAVLEYQETLNAMYNLTVSGSDNAKSNAARTREAFTSSMADIVRYNYAPTSTESNKGADGKSLEAAANAAEVLYSPGDLRECKVKIVGDPAWIMQGSQFKVLSNEMLGGQALTTGFLPDGSIAFDNQDVLFEIAWQRPQDYDLDTGLADPYSQTQKKYNNRTALQSRVYLCKKVVSEFRHGAFTQTLEGALYLFPVPNKTNTANPAAADDPRQGRGVGRADTSSSDAGGGQGSSQFAARDPRRLDIGDGGKAAILGAQNLAKQVPETNTTGVNPSSSIAQGVQQTLNPPKTLADPTLTQLTASPAYIAARRSGQTPDAALQAARTSFAATAGGSPVTSNGSVVATKAGNSAPVAGSNTRLTLQQIEQQSASRNSPAPIVREP